MINYDYLYDKTHYDKYSKVDHFSGNKLSWKIYNDAVEISIIATQKYV